jgi:O-methyltransferase involved in polyketide biosynthesis
MPRTDNDTWDLASSVGATATMVAAQRALANRDGLIDDPFAEPLVRAVGMDRGRPRDESSEPRLGYCMC